MNSRSRAAIDSFIETSIQLESNLSRLGAAMIFLQNQTVVSASITDSGVDFPGDADARATVGNTLRGDYPDSAGAVIQFIDAAAERAIAVSHRSNERDLLIVIARRVLINSRNICLAGTADHRQRAGENDEEKKASAK